MSRAYPMTDSKFPCIFRWKPAVKNWLHGDGGKTKLLDVGKSYDAWVDFQNPAAIKVNVPTLKADESKRNLYHLELSISYTSPEHTADGWHSQSIDPYQDYFRIQVESENSNIMYERTKKMYELLTGKVTNEDSQTITVSGGGKVGGGKDKTPEASLNAAVALANKNTISTDFHEFILDKYREDPAKNNSVSWSYKMSICEDDRIGFPKYYGYRYDDPVGSMHVHKAVSSDYLYKPTNADHTRSFSIDYSFY